MLMRTHPRVPTQRQIPCKPEMVRQILAGLKTQTRRIAPITALDLRSHEKDMTVWSVHFRRPIKGVLSTHSGGKVDEDQARSIIASEFCPYGQAGDQLWLRENWRTAKSLDALSPTAIGEKCLDAGYRTPWAPILYEADGARNNSWRGFESDGDATPGRPRRALHMPRWASRVTLGITSVSVERLQDISEADCTSEGCAGGHGAIPGYGYAASPQEHYRWLWDSIHGAGAWLVNPFVWVIDFQPIDIQEALQ